jgi:hypothetical protein
VVGNTVSVGLGVAALCLGGGCGGADGSTESGARVTRPNSQTMKQSSGTCNAYCLSVRRVPGKESGVFRISGSRWRPHHAVKATYGEPCDIRKGCSDVGIEKRLRTDARGRFTLLLRNGPAPSGNVVAGRGPVTFEQWSGRPFRSRLVRRVQQVP